MEYQDFPSKTFCLTVPRISVEKPFSVSLLSGADEVWLRERGEYQDFLSKFFCLTVPKKLVRESFSVSLISDMEKIFASEGYITIIDFLSIFFWLTVPQKFVVEPSVLCFKKFPVLKKLMEERGGSIMIFRRSLLV